MSTITVSTINLSILAGKIAVYKNPTALQEYKDKAEEDIEEICKALPHGSGVDGACKILLDESTENRIVFFLEYHHLNEGGYYDGWTEHKIIVTPSFMFGFEIKVTGRNRNDIKNYLGDMFADIFETE